MSNTNFIGLLLLGCCSWLGMLFGCGYGIYYGVSLVEDSNEWQDTSVATTCYLIEADPYMCSYNCLSKCEYGTLYEYTANSPEICGDVTLTNVPIDQDHDDDYADKCKQNYKEEMNRPMNCYVHDCKEFLLEKQHALNVNDGNWLIVFGAVMCSLCCACGCCGFYWVVGYWGR